MRFACTVDFRIGASESDLSSLLNLPQNSEGILPLDVYICPNCGRVELFASKEIEDSLLRIANQH